MSMAPQATALPKLQKDSHWEIQYDKKIEYIILTANEP